MSELVQHYIETSSPGIQDGLNVTSQHREVQMQNCTAAQSEAKIFRFSASVGRRACSCNADAAAHYCLALSASLQPTSQI
jgi:hypothetical protein